MSPDHPFQACQRSSRLMVSVRRVLSWSSGEISPAARRRFRISSGDSALPPCRRVSTDTAHTTSTARPPPRRRASSACPRPTSTASQPARSTTSSPRHFSGPSPPWTHASPGDAAGAGAHGAVAAAALRVRPRRRGSGRAGSTAAASGRSATGGVCAPSIPAGPNGWASRARASHAACGGSWPEGALRPVTPGPKVLHPRPPVIMGTVRAGHAARAGHSGVPDPQRVVPHSLFQPEDLAVELVQREVDDHRELAARFADTNRLETTRQHSQRDDMGDVSWRALERGLALHARDCRTRPERRRRRSPRSASSRGARTPRRRCSGSNWSMLPCSRLSAVRPEPAMTHSAAHMGGRSALDTPLRLADAAGMCIRHDVPVDQPARAGLLPILDGKLTVQPGQGDDRGLRGGRRGAAVGAGRNTFRVDGP